MSNNAEDYIFFYQVDEPHGWGSQWYPSPFKAMVTLPAAEGSAGGETEEEEEAGFPTAEHWMMFQKAVLFGDAAIAREVLAAEGTRASSMKRVKALGRKVQGFDGATWEAHRERIVLQGNLLKFRQNEDIRNKLLATGDKLIVEASPRDRIWGVGFGAKNALKQQDRWGLNLLGKALQETRRVIRDELKQQSSGDA